LNYQSRLSFPAGVYIFDFNPKPPLGGGYDPQRHVGKKYEKEKRKKEKRKRKEKKKNRKKNGRIRLFFFPGQCRGHQFD
jgi:hypothetical protein